MVDPDGPVPLYEQVAAILRKRIAEGELQANRLMPSAVRLQSEFGVARGTAIRALRLLVEEGRAYVVPGKGTYVRGPDGS